MVHANPEYDFGITGVMKIAHFCETLGLELLLHACGPARRVTMSTLRNSQFYELAMMGPEMPKIVTTVYACGHSDQPEHLGSDGCVPVPDRPGLGVVYN